MKQQYLLCALLFIVFAACNSTNKQTASNNDTLSPQRTDTTTNSSLAYKIDTSKEVTKLLVKRDTLLTVALKDNKGSVRGYLSGIGKHVGILVPVTSGDSIIAVITPSDDKANIRFNQIYIPVDKTGKYDGPFSRTLRYPITVKGNYRLVVGENLMAEPDWKGDFTCDVMIKNK